MLSDLLKSKRFWAAAASVAVVVFQDKLPLSADQINAIVLAIGSWIVGDSLRAVQPKAAA